MVKQIAVIKDAYIRDTQVLSADPEWAAENLAWDDNFIDVKYPCLYIGIFEGIDETEIKSKAAATLGVHPDIVSLIAIDYGQ